MEDRLIRELVAMALKEDLGSGDLTTALCIPLDTVVTGEFLAKEAGVLCGCAFLQESFAQMDSAVELEFLKADGDEIKAGDVIARVAGPGRSILTGERTALNFLQHLSGIATATRSCVKAVAGTGVRIADTRKTTPGLRAAEKYAVRTGGGVNHRFGLDGGILIKDNHIKGAGGIAAAVARARKEAPHVFKIEVEVETLSELKEALKAGADIIMLDNMTLEQMAEAVRLVQGAALLEASGNMGERDLRAVAETGVDLISIGALTNHVRGLDISLKFC